MKHLSDREIWRYGLWFAVSMMFWFWVFPDMLSARNDFEVFTALILGFIWIMLMLTHVLHLLNYKEPPREADSGPSDTPPADRMP